MHWTSGRTFSACNYCVCHGRRAVSQNWSEGICTYAVVAATRQNPIAIPNASDMVSLIEIATCSPSLLQ